MNVHNLEQSLSGWTGPPAPKLSPAPAATAPRFTTGSGFAKRPVRQTRPSTPAYGGATTRPVTVIKGARLATNAGFIPYYDERRRFKYSSEQIQRMLDRGKADELSDRQYREGGDGFDSELEQQADESNATDKAVEDSAGGTGLPDGIDADFPEKENALPLIALGALAYFLF